MDDEIEFIRAEIKKREREIQRLESEIDLLKKILYDLEVVHAMKLVRRWESKEAREK